MKKNNYWRFILQNTYIKEIKTGDNFEINDAEPKILHQLKKVFRCRPEDEIILINGKNKRGKYRSFRFKITEILPKTLKLVLQEVNTMTSPFENSMIMAICLPNKPAKLEDILMRCTELGASGFALIRSEYSNLNHKLRIDRLEKIVEEAVEQSEQGSLPTIEIFDSIKSFLSKTENQSYVAFERSEKSPLLTELKLFGDVNLIVGPEGGFSENENELFKSYDVKKFSLGKTILRNETAAILTAGIVSLKFQNESTS